ncbi:hypothetical protein L083_7360 [Actinoplanes sp. N902-109]|nr:hypothetical protein L083_7360 [Actinoplanes sp. N902-109]
MAGFPLTGLTPLPPLHRGRRPPLASTPAGFHHEGTHRNAAATRSGHAA